MGVNMNPNTRANNFQAMADKTQKQLDIALDLLQYRPGEMSIAKQRISWMKKVDKLLALHGRE